MKIGIVEYEGNKIFAIFCDECDNPIIKQDSVSIVMDKDNIYHLKCFKIDELEEMITECDKLKPSREEYLANPLLELGFQTALKMVKGVIQTKIDTLKEGK